MACLKKKLEKAMSKLPGKAQMDELLDISCSKLETDRGRRVVSFDKQPDVTKALYIEVPVNMKLRGNFFPLMIFFDELARVWNELLTSLIFLSSIPQL